jgi:hypothetical protein
MIVPWYDNEFAHITISISVSQYLVILYNGFNIPRLWHLHILTIYISQFNIYNSIPLVIISGKSQSVSHDVSTVKSPQNSQLFQPGPRIFFLREFLLAHEPRPWRAVTWFVNATEAKIRYVHPFYQFSSQYIYIYIIPLYTLLKKKLWTSPLWYLNMD